MSFILQAVTSRCSM